MTYERHWGLHGFTINRYKEQLEEVLTQLPADAPARGYVDRIIGICDHHLTSKELKKERDDDLIEKWEMDVVEKWIRGLLLNHPELSALIRV